MSVSMHVAVHPVPIGGERIGAAQAPPLSLPGEHFTAALGCLLLGSLGIVAIAPELALGAFFAPRVVATVHVFTLGWLMLSIFGALCQFLPVAIGRSFRWPWLAHVTFGLQVVGAAAFVTGFIGGHRDVVIVGASSVAAAFALVALNLGITLASVRERSLTWWALAAATVFLVVTPLYGVLLQLHRVDGLGVHRYHVVAVHAHVAIVGVVLLVVVGVAHRLLPMFLLSHGASERPAWLAVGLLATAATLLAIPVGGLTVDAIGGVLAAAGVGAFAVQAALFVRHRKRRAIDPGMRLAFVGIAGLVVAMGIAPFALSRGLADLRLLTTYFVMLLMSLSLFVAAHYFKIVPFLVWYHRFGPLVGTRKVPKVSELYSERAAYGAGILLVTGVITLGVGTYSGSIALTRGAAIVFAAGVLVEIIILAGIARRRPA